MCDGGGAARLALSLLDDMADDWERSGRFVAFSRGPTCPDPACDPGGGDAEHSDGCRFAAFLRFRPLPPPARRPRARSVQFFPGGASGSGPRPVGGMMVVWLADGRRLSVPLRWFPRLAHGTAAELARWELIARGGGIHWPLLDEDISVGGLLAGRRSGECGASVARWRKWLAAERETARLVAARPKRKARVARPGAGGDWIYGNPMKPGYGMAKRRGRKAKKS